MMMPTVDEDSRHGARDGRGLWHRNRREKEQRNRQEPQKLSLSGPPVAHHDRDATGASHGYLRVPGSAVSQALGSKTPRYLSERFEGYST